MKFQVICAYSGKLLLGGKLVEAATEAEARLHLLEEFNGAFTPADFLLRPVGQTSIPRKPYRARPKKCRSCGYLDLTGADKCPGCGYDAQSDTDAVEQETG